MCRGDLQLFNLQFPEASKARARRVARPRSFATLSTAIPITCTISTSFRTPSVPRRVVATLSKDNQFGKTNSLLLTP